MKAQVRRALAGLYHVRRGWASRLRGKVAILAYHRVLPARALQRTFVQPGMYVLDTAFDAQMRFVRDEFEVLSMAALLAAWRDGTLDGRGPYCVVTFDDGWVDNYVHAYPVLRRLGIPATIFLVTAFVGREQWFWPDRLAYVLREARRRSPALGTRGLERPIDETIEQWKSLGQAEIDRRLDAMSRDARVEVPPERTQLSWAEVAEMSAGGVSFGSHSASHAILTQLEVQELRRELEDSLTELRRRCIDSVPVFCYPNGDYNDRVVEAVAAAGYTGAFTTDFGCETPVPRDLFRLRRIGIHQDICGTIPLFAFHLAGLNQALAGAARRTLG